MSKFIQNSKNFAKILENSVKFPELIENLIIQSRNSLIQPCPWKWIHAQAPLKRRSTATLKRRNAQIRNQAFEEKYEESKEEREERKERVIEMRRILEDEKKAKEEQHYPYRHNYRSYNQNNCNGADTRRNGHTTIPKVQVISQEDHLYQ